jgi:hypothetical protein
LRKIVAVIVLALVAASAFALVKPIQPARAAIPGDLNGDGIVDINDAVIASHAFGSSTGDTNYNPAADLNSNGVVDIFDMLILATNFGRTA